MKLKATLHTPGALLCPGVYDALSALLAVQAGFQGLYLSGASIAYTQLGRSDVGLTTYSEVLDVLRRITERVDVPVIVDADTGFGNAINVQRTVQGLERAGASMIQLEDQDFPKRCGHLNGKRLVSTGEMVGKLKAALDARRDENTLILARTDALAVEGWDAAMARAEAYVAAGVDALFIEALRSDEQLASAAQTFGTRIPLLANMVEGGKTPIMSADQLGQLGYKLVIFPGGTVRALAHAMQAYFGHLHGHLSTNAYRDRMLDFDQLNAVIGTPELLAHAQQYAEAAVAKG